MTDFNMGVLFGEIHALVEQWDAADTDEKRIQALALNVAFLTGVVGMLAARLDGLDRMVTALMAAQGESA